MCVCVSVCVCVVLCMRVYVCVCGVLCMCVCVGQPGGSKKSVCVCVCACVNPIVQPPSLPDFLRTHCTHTYTHTHTHTHTHIGTMWPFHISILARRVCTESFVASLFQSQFPLSGTGNLAQSDEPNSASCLSSFDCEVQSSSPGADLRFGQGGVSTSERGAGRGKLNFKIFSCTCVAKMFSWGSRLGGFKPPGSAPWIRSHSHLCKQTSLRQRASRR